MSNDSMNIGASSEFRDMLNRFGYENEQVLFSGKVKKINKKGWSQTRILVVTDVALYNMKEGKYSVFKRRIGIKNVGAVTLSSGSNEIVLHVPDEYDYRYATPQKEVVMSLVRKGVKKITGNNLRVFVVESASLSNVTVTKEMAVNLSRDQVLIRKKKLAAVPHLSDAEEEKHMEDDYEQILSGDSKLRVESFELIKVLGRGAFGKVMLVRKRDTGVFYAMKILKKTMIFARKQIAHTKAERQVLEDFQHPFLMGLRFAFQTKAKLYLVMDFYKGGELFFHLRKVKRFTESQAKIYVAEVALALGHLHTLDFIYRDLKPENILMDENGHICLTDFGLAKQLNPENEPVTHSFVGTPEYLAPEMIKGKGHDKAVDWWCLGILLYELTVGITPFYSGNVDEMYHKIVHAKLRFPPRLSEDCKALITALLKRDPNERLGNSPSDIQDVIGHAFFSDLDIPMLLKKKIPSSYLPRVGEQDGAIDCFSDQFLNEPVIDSVVPLSHLKNLPPNAADQFSEWSFQASSNIE